MKKLIIILLLLAMPTVAFGGVVLSGVVADPQSLSFAGQTCYIDGAGDDKDFIQPASGNYSAFAESTTLIYESDFSAGVDGFIAGRGVAVGNIDADADGAGLPPSDNYVRFTCDNTNGGHQIYKDSLLTIGKLYSVSYTYYIPTGQSNVDGIAAIFGNTTSTIHSITGVETTVTDVGIPDNAYYRFYAMDGVSSSFIDAGGDDVFYVKDIVIEEVTSRRLITVTDSTGKTLTGYAGQVGGGYTYAANIAELAALDLQVGWSFTNASASDANTYSSTGATGIAQRILIPIRSLYKTTFDSTQTAGLTYIAGESNNPKYANDGDSDIYKTSINTTLRIINGGGPAVVDINTIEMLRILDCAATGLQVYTTATGATRGWASQTAGFDYNASDLVVTFSQE